MADSSNVYALMDAQDGPQQPAAAPVNIYAQMDSKDKAKAAPVDLGQTALDQFNEGTTFGWGHNVSDRVGAAIAANATMPKNGSFSDFGDAYDKQLADQQAQTKQDLSNEFEQNPVTSLASQGAGGLVGGTIVGAAKPVKAVAGFLGNSIQGINNPVLKLAAKMLQGAGTGAVAGGVYGAGEADPGHRLEGAEAAAGPGAVGGAAIPALVAGAGEVKNTVGDMLASKNKIVGQMLNKLATDPAAAEAALRNAQTFVPNSPQTVAEVTGDQGLSSLQRGLRNTSPEDFANIISSKNTAQTAMLDKIAGTPADILAAEKARDAATAPLRQAAFANKRNVMPQEPIDVIDQLMQGPSGNRDSVSSAMKWAQDKIMGTTDPEGLYEVRKDIAEAISGKYDADKPSLRRAASSLMQVRDALDQTIERGAPGYQNYMQEYASQTKPISQMRELQDLKNGVTSSQYDPATGQYYLSQPKFSNYMKSNGQDLSKTLSPQHMADLDNIGYDLNQGSYANNPAIRPTNSDTVANAMKNGKISALADTLLGKVPGLKNLQAGRDASVRQNLTEALTNPQVAQKLMSKYKPPQPGGATTKNALAAMLMGRQLVP